MYTNTLRFTGLSGIDTESMVQSLMQAESIPYNRMKADLQILNWQQESYRSSMTSIQSFQSSFLDILSSSNIMSSSNFTGKMTTNILDAYGNPSTAITASTLDSGKSLELSNVTIAETLKMESGATDIGNITTSGFDVNEIEKDDAFVLNLDGSAKYIIFDGWSEELSSYENWSKNEDDGTSDEFAKWKTDNPQGTLDQYNQQMYEKDRTNYLVDKLNEDMKSTFGSESDGTAKVSIAATTVDGNTELQFKTTSGHSLAVAEAWSRHDDENRILSDGVETEGFATAMFGEDGKVGDEYEFSFTVELSDGTEETITGKVTNTDGWEDEDYIVELMNQINSGLKSAGLSSDLYIAAASATIEPATGDPYEGYNVGFVPGNTTQDITITGLDGVGDLAGLLNIPNSESVDDDGVKFEIGRTSSLEGFGFTSMDSNSVSGTEKLSDLLGSDAFADGDQTLTFGNTTVTIGANTTLNQLNSALSKVGYNLEFNDLSRKFTFSSQEVGASNNISDEDAATLKDLFGVGDTTKGGTLREASDAQFTVDGVTTSRTSNSFTLDGINITLNKNTEVDEVITVGFAQDTTAMYDTIKNFVDGYNALIDEIKLLTSEARPKQSDGSYYSPLTDEEKAAMDQDTIDLWEENAKKGLLSGDSILEGVLSSMRTELYNSVPTSSGGSIALYEIGITTGDWQSGGKLVIDEDKLMKAIEERPEDIEDLFTKSSDVARKNNVIDPSRMSTQGLGDRLNDILYAAVGNPDSSLQAKAGLEGGFSQNENTLSKKIQSDQYDIDDMLLKLMAKEESYYAMFAAMDAAVNASNAQLSYLMSALGM